MNILYIQASQDHENPLFLVVSVIFLIILVISIAIYCVLRYLETIYIKIYKKPFFVHFYPFKKKLPVHLRNILVINEFYNQLDNKHKDYFKHRVYKFLNTVKFIGREGLVIDDDKRMKVAVIFVQMTFGMRHYLLAYLNTIIIYPTTYYSILSKTDNNGEFNPRSKAIVFSWEHFISGNRHENDGINLGIHEITHAIHYTSFKGDNSSSEIFHDTFLELEKYLSSVDVRNKIKDSNVLRAYAFTDKFEFIAVVVEVFMETPDKLKKEFPELYKYVEQMLNFRYFN